MYQVQITKLKALNTYRQEKGDKCLVRDTVNNNSHVLITREINHYSLHNVVKTNIFIPKFSLFLFYYADEHTIYALTLTETIRM